jgi:hypothetical protein
VVFEDADHAGKDSPKQAWGASGKSDKKAASPRNPKGLNRRQRRERKKSEAVGGKLGWMLASWKHAPL